MVCTRAQRLLAAKLQEDRAKEVSAGELPALWPITHCRHHGHPLCCHAGALGISVEFNDLHPEVFWHQANFAVCCLLSCGRACGYSPEWLSLGVLWMQERVGLFRRWVQAQPEQVIVAYGHSSMIKELSGGKRLRNCDLLTMQL